MSSWNYRFMYMTDSWLCEDDDTYIALREVYYDDDGKPVAHSPTTLWFNTQAEIQSFMDKMKEAAGKDFLHEADFPEIEEDPLRDHSFDDDTF